MVSQETLHKATVPTTAGIAEAAVHAAGVAPAYGRTIEYVAAAPEAPAAPAAAPNPVMAAGGAVLVVLLLGFYLHTQLKSKKARVPHVLAAFTMGVLLAGSVLGAVALQASNTAGASLTQLLTTVTGTPGGGAPTGTR
ncbi:hypothetical protein [Actinomadura macrotermitis]|uniref:Uncharacterized protein n=1 Tax=Actinomadura macrotermitis TaxID=2585200 RepID=A0A7K0BSG3_9ACTN|nr:hypothetical protein [Actinomadura macrotermitis]MQY04145.1 hypothetical protein [Actinomadura macrotermitis]